MIRLSVLMVALLVNAPTIYAALWTQTVPVTTAAVHFLVAVGVLAVLMALLRQAFRPAPTKARTRSKR